MDALKKFANRARQKSEEIILNAEKTEINAEIEQLLAKAEKMEDQLKKLIHSIEAYVQPSPASRVLDPRKDKSRQNTMDHLGETMKETAKAIGNDSAFGGALVKASQTEAKMAGAERQFSNAVTTQTVASIRRLLDNEMRTVQRERSTLNKKRLDLDVTKSRWKRASSAERKAIVDAELRAAQFDFDNQLDSVCNAMMALQTAMDQQADQMTHFASAQLQFFTTCNQHLADLKRTFGSP